MSKYIQVKISDKDIDEAMEEDLSYSEAVKKLVLFYIKCQCNDIDFEKLVNYSGSIIDDISNRVMQDSLDGIIDESVGKGRDLTPDEFKMLKDNDLLDDFLKRVTERGLGKHTEKDNNDDNK